MAKTIILGAKYSMDLSTELQATLIDVPDLYVNDYGAVNDFIVDKLKLAFDILIIDAENIRDSELALTLALYVRLSVVEIGANALNPIIIASDKPIKSFLRLGGCSQLLLSKNVYFQPRTAIMANAVEPLDAKKYREDFLDYIIVQSGPDVGRHSIANQWGAGVIERLLNGGVLSENAVIKSAFKSLYFKYVLAKNIDVADYLLGKQNKRFYIQSYRPINGKGKRILLIDDEADKGWEYVLRKLIATDENDFNVISHKVEDFFGFTGEEQSQIIEGDYDLIFLDLRMNGVEEESVYRPEDFSGMKILKEIKQKSIGTQVIMLTASTKAWNLKALLEAGADGFYIKESPEYNFSIKFSEANLESLRKSIKVCLNRTYLRQVDKTIKDIRKDLLKSKYEQQFKYSIVKQIEGSFSVLLDGYFAFAFVTLCQTIEMINSHYLKQGDDNMWYFMESGEQAKNWSVGNAKKECREITFTDSDKKEKYPEWKKAASIYYQLWQQVDLKFGEKLQSLIEQRNYYMHNDPRLSNDINTPVPYLELMDVVVEMCSNI